MGVGRGDWPAELWYIGELDWCSKHGIAQTYWQWLDLPHAVIEDCRLVMRAESMMSRDDKQPTQDLLAQERA